MSSSPKEALREWSDIAFPRIIDKKVRPLYNDESNFLQSKYTPKELIEEIFNKINDKMTIPIDRKICVWYSIEIALYMVRKGYDDITLVVLEHNKVIAKLCEIFDIKYQLIDNGNTYMPKFDVVIGNPPYKGTGQLHQQFFNLAVDLVKDGGIVAFLQPATPYLENKEKIKKFARTEKMKENIRRYETEVWMFNPNMYVFDADIGNILAVSILKKTLSGDETVSKVTYDFNGESKTFSNIPLEDITIHGSGPLVVKSIRKKILKFIKQNESLNSIVDGEEKPYLCRLGKIRGDISGRNIKKASTEPFFKDSFFTLVAKERGLHVYRTEDYDYDGFVIYCDTLEQANNVYDYCTTKFVQFAISLSKITFSNHRGELNTVPLLDFNTTWTDEKLFKLFDLSDEEIDFINDFIGDFY